jgi:hypothetical protein
MPLANLIPKKSVNTYLSERIGHETLVFAFLNATFLFVPLANKVFPSLGGSSPPLTSYFPLIIGLGIAVTTTFRIYDQVREARTGSGNQSPRANLMNLQKAIDMYRCHTWNLHYNNTANCFTLMHIIKCFVDVG